MTPTYGFLITLGLAAFFYKAADFENLPHPVVWGGASILVGLAAVYGLG